MKQLLSANYSFTIEPYKERLRLIVYKHDKEYVCRKENKKNLSAFLSSKETQLFKGRLQLQKADDMIIVQVKGEVIGEITPTDFQQLLADV